MDYRLLHGGMVKQKGDYPYSVAEHSLLVEEIFSSEHPSIDKKWRLAALLHDASEYVIGDMISPVKSAIGKSYDALDQNLTQAIHIRFGLPVKLPKIIKAQIKRADNQSAWLEATEIAGFTPSEADSIFPLKLPKYTQFQVRLRPPIEVKKDYLKKFEMLIE